MDLLKKNWLTIVLAIVSVISGADVAAGLSQGKALLNLTNIPSIGLGGASLVTIFLRWFNGRAVTTRAIPPGLGVETMQLLESLFVAASHQDVTPEMAKELGDMASAAVVGYADRARMSRGKVSHEVK